MKLPLTLIGSLLMVLAFVILGTFIIAPAVIAPLDNAPVLKNFLQGVLCHQGETLTASYSEYDTPTSTTRSNDMECVDSEGQQRDVNGSIIGIGLVGYLVPFLGGLFLTITGSWQRRQRMMGIYRTPYQDNVSPLVGGMNVRFDRFDNNSASVSHGHGTLTQRLSELKGAFDAGLLTQDEYDSKRKELLK